MDFICAFHKQSSVQRNEKIIPWVCACVVLFQKCTVNFLNYIVDCVFLETRLCVSGIRL